MKSLTIFLNELSLATDVDLNAQELLPHLLETLHTARSTKKLRPDLTIAGGLTRVALGSGLHTFASVLRGADYREEWQFLRSLEQASPWDDNDVTLQNQLEEVRFHNVAGVGLLWAMQNKSAVLSFAFTATWDGANLAAKHSRLNDVGEVVLADIDIPNLAKREHATIHEELIRHYGFDLSSSSIIHESNNFVLRMYFCNDHDPPHFHLMAQDDPSQTIARFDIQTLDQLTQLGSLRPALRREVVAWADGRRAALMECWQDCRNHRHPARLV